MTQDRVGLWNRAEAYERYMGRWSRRVAPLFLDWLAAPDEGNWIDVGCGTGALSAAIIERCRPQRVVGIDMSEAFTEVARAQIHDDRFRTVTADGTALPVRDGEFSSCVSGLVLNFVPDEAMALAEMVRVVGPGRQVGLYVWDYAGHMQIMRRFFDSAYELDPTARQFDDGYNAPICRPVPLTRLFEESGLADVEVTAIDVPAPFTDFNDYWSPFLGGTGSGPKYCASLSEPARERLRETLRSRLPTGPDGEILLAVRAWAVKGVVG